MALADQYPELIRDRVVAAAFVGTSSGRLGEVNFGLPVAGVQRRAAGSLPGVLRALGQQAALVEKGRAGDRRPVRRDHQAVLVRVTGRRPGRGRFAERMIEGTPIDVVAEFYPAFTDHDKTAGARLLDGLPVLVLAGDQGPGDAERAQRGHRRPAAGRRTGARPGRRAPGDAGAPGAGRPTRRLAGGRCRSPVRAARAAAGADVGCAMAHRTTRHAPAPGGRPRCPDHRPHPEQMRELGRRLAKLLRAGDLVMLNGELGAGKTTLTRGLGEGLGVRGAVTSPTFVIARVHPSLGDGPPLVHVDAYRLGGGLDEMEDLDLDVSLSGLGDRRGVGRGQGRGADRRPAARRHPPGRRRRRTGRRRRPRGDRRS